MTSRLLVTVAIAASMFSAACAQEATAPVVVAASAAQSAATASFTAPDSAWRSLDQDDLIYVETDHGLFVIELYEDIAPAHVAQIKALANSRFYDHITFHRVIDGFMNQTGDPKGDGTGDSDRPNIPAEFTFRRDPAMSVSLIDKRKASVSNPGAGFIDVGFYKAMPVATQPSAQAMISKDGKVDAWGLHCPGVTSMARSSDPNSGNSQFFLMRNKSEGDDPVSHLDTQYSVWGTTVWGEEHVDKIKIGAKGQDPSWVPDKMNTVRLGSELSADKQLNLQVLKTSGPQFNRFMDTQKTDTGYKDICKIVLPARIAP